MYIDTSQIISSDENKIDSFQRTEYIQNSKISFYYDRFSTGTNDSNKSMGTFRTKLLLNRSTWSTRYEIPKNDRYINSSAQWTLVSLKFNIKNFGIKLVCDQEDTPHNDMYFSNNTVTQLYTERMYIVLKNNLNQFRIIERLYR